MCLKFTRKKNGGTNENYYVDIEESLRKLSPVSVAVLLSLQILTWEWGGGGGGGLSVCGEKAGGLRVGSTTRGIWEESRGLSQALSPTFSIVPTDREPGTGYADGHSPTFLFPLIRYCSYCTFHVLTFMPGLLFLL